jgi:NAD(P)-dependent dehydrogenase (short-subunit alcohol dehydrogenase family)
VAIHYHSSQKDAEDLCQELKDAGCDAIAIQADLGDSSAVEPLFDEAWAAFGGLDFLVNNASIFPAGRLEELELRSLHENLQVNAWAPFLLTRAFWRKLNGTKARGSVVNLLDTRLKGGDLAHAAYHLSKAVLLEFTRLTALEFSPSLQVNGVAPGAVMPPEGLDEGYLEELTVGLPLKRRGHPEDIVDATLFLLGTSFVTGQVVFVDGGRHLRPGGSP